MACYFGLDSENDCRGTPCASCTANEPDDLVTICKMSVIKAACGIKSLEDKDLLDRLESLFLMGVKEGVNAKGNEMPLSLEKQYAESLGRLAQLCDTVIPWVLGSVTDGVDIPHEVRTAMGEIMGYLDAVRP